VSAAGFLCYRADGRRARLYLHSQPGSYTSDILIPALRALRRRLRAPVVLIWDGLNSHWSHKMAAFVASQRWLQVERLPGYAPDLNPCEGLWANLKGGDLANRAVKRHEESPFCDIRIPHPQRAVSTTPFASRKR